MLPMFIIPSLLLLAGVRAKNERLEFDQVIKVNFVLTNSTTDYPDFSWKDATSSTGLEDPSGLFASYPNTTNDIVGVESFMYVNETRFIVWTPKRVEGELQRLCSITLKGDPKTTSIKFDLLTEKPAVGQGGNMEMLDIDCEEDTSRMTDEITPSGDAAQFSATSVPFKTPLLVTFLAKPDHVDSALPSGGWKSEDRHADINDGSVDTPDANDKNSHPTTDSQVMVGPLKFKGSTQEEREYTWTGNSTSGPVFKQCFVKVISDLDVPEMVVWVDSSVIEQPRQSFFHRCRTTLHDGSVIQQ